MIVPVKCKLDAAGNCMDLEGNGTFDGYPDSIQQAPTTLVADAHRAGLFVHEYTPSAARRVSTTCRST